MEFLTFGLVEIISGSLDTWGVGRIIPESLIWSFLIIAYILIVFSLILGLHIGHAKFMHALNRFKLKKNWNWKKSLKSNKKLSFEDQFDELFARS
ncbi:MAG: hypothetical protein R6V46_16140 [Desulfatiglandaceae bacterium]|jgi:hypothetical protein